MTRFIPIDIKCSVCGCTGKYQVLMSTNTFGGSMDLDTRPPEMKRSTMHLWVQECQKCGYVSEEVSDETSIAREYLNSECYTSCDGIMFKSELAKRFYKYYMINLLDENRLDAFYASLHSAWASDDAGDIKTAEICRKNCINMIPYLETEEDYQLYYVMNADLLRRIGEYDKVINEYEGVIFNDELLEKIRMFQVNKAQEKDSKVYTVSDVLEFEKLD